MTSSDTPKLHRETRDPHTTVDSHTDKALDEALKGTFPASDPVSISIDKLPATKIEHHHA